MSNQLNEQIAKLVVSTKMLNCLSGELSKAGQSLPGFMIFDVYHNTLDFSPRHKQRLGEIFGLDGWLQVTTTRGDCNWVKKLQSGLTVNIVAAEPFVAAVSNVTVFEFTSQPIVKAA